MTVLAFLFSLVTLCYSVFLLLVARKFSGSWSRCSLILIIILVLSIYFPLAVSSSFYVSGLATIYLYIVGFSFLTGSCLGFILSNNKFKNTKIINTSIFGTKDVKLFWFLGVISGLLAIRLTLGQSEMLSFDASFYSSIVAISVNNAAERYQGIAEPSVVLSLLVAFNYFACLLAGAFNANLKLKGLYKYRHIIIVIIPLFTLFCFGVLQNTKAVILYGCVLYISGYIPVILLYPKQRIFIKPLILMLLKLLLLLAALLLMLVKIQSIRYGDSYLNGTEVYVMVIEYAVGHVSGFAYWFDHYYNEYDLLLFGTKTFAGIANLFGESIQGGQTLQQEKIISQDLVTNLDTLFADIILDFGVIGSILFIFVLGLISGFLDRLQMHGRVLAVPFMAFLIAFFLWSFVTSIFTYSSIILALILFLAHIVFKMIRVRKPHV